MTVCFQKKENNKLSLDERLLNIERTIAHLVDRIAKIGEFYYREKNEKDSDTKS